MSTSWVSSFFTLIMMCSFWSSDLQRSIFFNFALVVQNMLSVCFYDLFLYFNQIATFLDITSVEASLNLFSWSVFLFTLDRLKYFSTKARKTRTDPDIKRNIWPYSIKDIYNRTLKYIVCLKVIETLKIVCLKVMEISHHCQETIIDSMEQALKCIHYVFLSFRGGNRI